MDHCSWSCVTLAVRRDARNARYPRNIQDLENSQCDPDDSTEYHNNRNDQPEGHDAATWLAFAVVTNDRDGVGHAVKFAGKDFVERLATGWLLSDGVSVSGAIIIDLS